MPDRNFTPFPILTTERLTLRKLSVDDTDAVFALRSNEEINRYSGRKPAKSMEDAVRFINMINDSIGNNNSVYWAITLTGSKAFAGTICLYDFVDENDECEIGYELLIDYQRRGIMMEAAQSVISYAFRNLQMNKIKAFTHSGNQNSTKLLEKLNFTKSGEGTSEDPFIIFTRENQ